jgi:DNA processing protein
MDEFLVAFASVPGIGAARLRLLLKYFGSAENAWNSKEEELLKTGLPKDTVSELVEQQKKIKPHEYVSEIQKRGIQVVTIFDSDYPERLRNIPDPPNVLFIKSNLTVSQFNDLTKRKIIGIVGTRKMTSYGKEITEKLTTQLAQNGFTIVSGMALGVDGVAHGTAINHHAPTIAVLGAGVEIVYPREHKDLYQNIFDRGGAIVSEVAPEKMVGRGIFPARNRIVSGLSEAVLVTEGAIDSGSLITARCALDQGREVFAVPGPIICVMDEGKNYLLKQGAKLVTDVSDILETLGYEANVTSNGHERTIPKGETSPEKLVKISTESEPESKLRLLSKGNKIAFS